MARRDDEYWIGQDSGGGKFRAAVRRVFGDGENPLTWAFPLYRLWGIQVRVHLVFVLLAAVELVRSFWVDAGPLFTASWIVSLFVLVLLHEYGHCFACRRVGGEADQILMWPLGGLASVAPPFDWRAHLLTTAAGPGVNLVLAPILGGLVLAITGSWGAVIFNPFDYSAGFAALRLPGSGLTPSWLIVLWSVYYMNLVLLAFNVLVPMYPMDGGRLLQEGLWAKLGYERAMQIAARVGLGAAVALFIVGVVGSETILMAIALLGGITCWMEIRRQKFAEDPRGGVEYATAYLSDEQIRGGSVEQDEASERKRREREEADQRELDRLLEKISKTGMGSLTAREKRWLRRTSERRRRG